MSLLIVKNIAREGPGILKTMLDRYHIPFVLVEPDSNEDLPDPGNYSAVVILGGPDSANDRSRKIIRELDMVRKTVTSGVPYLGICLGMQILVRACGGDVYPDVKETGFRDPYGEHYSLNICEEHAGDPLFNGLDHPLRIFHLHGETVRINDNMQLLATGKHCRHQIVKIGDNAYGIQGHFELTKTMLHEWLEKDPELMELDREALVKDMDLLYREYQNNGERLFKNFLKIADII